MGFNIDAGSNIPNFLNLKINNNTFVDSDRNINSYKITPPSGSCTIDSKTHGFGLYIKADNLTCVI